MKKVVIIGCGAAGLAAASRLIKNGLTPENLIILEAQDRIGGRIHTVVKGFQLKLRMILLSFTVWYNNRECCTRAWCPMGSWS